MLDGSTSWFLRRSRRWRAAVPFLLHLMRVLFAIMKWDQQHDLVSSSESECQLASDSWLSLMLVGSFEFCSAITFFAITWWICILIHMVGMKTKRIWYISHAIIPCVQSYGKNTTVKSTGKSCGNLLTVSHTRTVRYHALNLRTTLFPDRTHRKCILNITVYRFMSSHSKIVFRALVSHSNLAYREKYWKNLR